MEHSGCPKKRLLFPSSRADEGIFEGRSLLKLQVKQEKWIVMNITAFNLKNTSSSISVSESIITTL